MLLHWCLLTAYESYSRQLASAHVSKQLTHMTMVSHLLWIWISAFSPKWSTFLRTDCEGRGYLMEMISPQEVNRRRLEMSSGALWPRVRLRAVRFRSLISKVVFLIWKVKDRMCEVFCWTMRIDDFALGSLCFRGKHRPCGLRRIQAVGK